jgi:hypothetical protein
MNTLVMRGQMADGVGAKTMPARLASSFLRFVAHYRGHQASAVHDEPPPA